MLLSSVCTFYRQASDFTGGYSSCLCIIANSFRNSRIGKKCEGKVLPTLFECTYTVENSNKKAIRKFMRK